MSNQSTLDKVRRWSDARNFYDFDNGIAPIPQTFKVLEELGELYAGLLRNNEHEIKDGIGDINIASFNLRTIFEKFKFSQHTTLTADEHNMLLAMHNIGELATSILLKREDMFSNSLDRVLSAVDAIATSKTYDKNDCMLAAYETIKDRQGKMINRNFVKHEDLAKVEFNNAKHLLINTENFADALLQKVNSLMTFSSETIANLYNHILIINTDSIERVTQDDIREINEAIAKALLINRRQDGTGKTVGFIEALCVQSSNFNDAFKAMSRLHY